MKIENTLNDTLNILSFMEYKKVSENLKKEAIELQIKIENLLKILKDDMKQ